MDQGSGTTADRLAGGLRDACYVAVGLGLIGFQRAQVARQALLKRLRAKGLDLDGGWPGLGQTRRLAEEALSPLAAQVAEAIELAGAGLERLVGRGGPGD
jgi:hypothetical protein